MIDEFVIDIQRASQFVSQPTDEELASWAKKLLELNQLKQAELSIRIIDEKEMQALNFEYRKKHKATNVLSFPAHMPEGFALPVPLLGDIVICAPVIVAEAKAQGKTLEAHWVHMLLHGILHLLGFDHQTDKQAEVMEKKEVEILSQLGFSDPYKD